MSTKWIEKKAKRAVARAAMAVLPSRTLDPSAMDWSEVRRILLVRQDKRIGDLVMNTPLFHGVKARFPKAESTLLLYEAYQGLFWDDPFVDEVLPFSHGRDLHNPFGLAALASKLRERRFDLAIDCSNFRSFSLTNGFLTWLSGAPVRIGFDDKESPAFLNVLIAQGESRHYTENQMELLTPVGVTGVQAKPSIHFSASRLQGAGRLLAEIGLEEGSPKAIVFTDAGNSDKRWSMDCFVQVAKNLQESGIAVALAHGPGSDRQVAALRSDGGLLPKGSIPALPPLKIADFAAAVACCDAFISGDTGPMHIAYACGVSTISVFMEDNIRRYGYGGEPKFCALRVSKSDGVAEVTEAALRALEGVQGWTRISQGAGS